MTSYIIWAIYILAHSSRTNTASMQYTWHRNIIQGVLKKADCKIAEISSVGDNQQGAADRCYLEGRHRSQGRRKEADCLGFIWDGPIRMALDVLRVPHHVLLVLFSNRLAIITLSGRNPQLVRFPQCHLCVSCIFSYLRFLFYLP